MSTDQSTAGDACTPSCRPPRHLHPSPDLDATLVACGCGGIAWYLAFGGPLPASVACGACLQSYPLEAMITRRRRLRGGD